MKIGIIGCGHMGSAIAAALIAKNIGSVFVGNPEKPKVRVHWTVDNRQVVVQTDIVIIGVKPGMVESVLREITPFLKKKKILISIAAGIPIKKLTAWSNGHKKIARVMPNLPVQVFEGISVWKGSAGLENEDKKIVKKILNSFGKELKVKNESLLNAATAASAGAPAYLGAFLESMAVTLEKLGFSEDEARRVALQAARGSVAYFEKTGLSFGEVKKAVQTKGGTTEAAFKVLIKKKWQQILQQALEAAYQRSQEIGK